MGNFRRLGTALYDNGWQVLPADGKAVKVKDWEEIPITRKKVESWAANGMGGHNVSIRLGPQPDGTFAVLIDIDCYDKDLTKTILASFRETFDMDPPIRIGMSPKIGLLVQLDETTTKISTPNWLGPGHTKEKPNSCKVEVLASGQQCVVYGTHPDTGKPYRWQGDDTPEAIEPWALPTVSIEELTVWLHEEVPTLIPTEWIKRGSGRKGRPYDPEIDADPEMAVFTKKKSRGYSIEKIKEVLSRLPDEMCDEHDEWIKVGQAIHHETDGAEEGLEIWDKWSELSVSYEDGACERRWRTFKKGRSDAVTMGSLEFVAKKPDRETVKGEYASVEDMREAFPELQSTLIQMQPIEREATLKRLLETYRKLSGDKTSLSAFKRELANSITPDSPTETRLPEWASRHVWLRTEDKFISRTTGQKLSTRSFDMSFGSNSADLQIFDHNEGRNVMVTPSRLWMMRGGQEADTCLYWPKEPERVFRMNGLNCFNTYNPRSKQAPAEKWSKEGKIIKEAIERHLKLLVPNPKHRELVLSWFAYNYQYPGEKIMWAPLIISAHGAGKNVLVEMFQLAVGPENVKTVTGNTAVSSPFTGYVAGAQVVFIDELYQVGSHHWVVSEKLKNAIASNVVEVHAKGKDPVNLPNCTNFFCSSNYKDCLSIEDGERRYFVIYAPHDRESLARILEEEHDISMAEHFSQLTDLARAHPKQVAKFFEEYQISEDFKPFESAPETEHRKELVASSRPAEESALDSLLLDGDHVGVTNEIVSARHLLDAAGVPPHRHQDRTRVLRKVLQRAGFEPWREGANLLKWGGEYTRVWVKPELLKAPKEKALSLLNASKLSQFDEED